MSRILITGATGQVGNAIARRLAGDGVEVRALVRSAQRAEVLPEGVEPVSGEVHRRHHISPNGYYRGKQVIKAKGE